MTAAAGAPRHAVPPAIDPRNLRGLDPRTPVVDLCGETMGTTWRVRLACPPTCEPARLAPAIEARLARISDEMSHWSETSTLARFNRSTPGSWTALPPDFAAVIAAGLDIARRTDGAFDPGLGRVTDLWGLGPNRRAAPPSRVALAAAREVSGWRRLALADGRWLRQPGGLWLDLSGIAKGYAADAVADLAAAAGLGHALVEIGGECVGRGFRPDGDPWWVDLEAPPPADLPLLRVALHQLAVATSGSYVRGAHTLGPLTGGPAPAAPLAVSVLHASCMYADAWATALTALEPTRAREVARQEGLAVRIVEPTGDEWLSPALKVMLD